MKGARASRGRQRAARALSELPAGRPLIQAVDHGPAVLLEGAKLGATGHSWVEPFLEANRSHLRRLAVVAQIETRPGIALRLIPGPRIGAVPLLSPSTRRVAAGLLVAPRFRWSALGAVLGDIGFATEPALGGTPMVPGSAREVPGWLMAAPVIRRLEAFLKHRKRGFSERAEVRSSPRGRVDWSKWATTHVPSGDWATLPCHFSEPDDDPTTMAAVRWTLAQLDDELALFQEAAPARLLRARVSDLRAQIGAGQTRRPRAEIRSANTGWVADAMQAMGWIAEKRGLGGARVLDGMSWDLPIDEVWEAWVDAFVADLAPRCGFSAIRRGETDRRLNWSMGIGSMRKLIPDSGLRAPGRLVWVDAKYKAHLQLISRRGWSGLAETTQDAHRADLHQALAYAALDEVEHIDSLLVYPDLSPEDQTRPAVATLAAGRRRVRLLLVGLPFGFKSPAHREKALSAWRELLAA